nr:DUF1428 domain-containing protein [uncultured Roseococcus sp.]
MSYVQGFVLAVPAANKEAYRKMAASHTPLFKEFGASRVVHAWGDDVPEGKVTDFNGAVQAKPEETVVISWHEYPSHEAAQQAYGRMMTDPRMKALMAAARPFDGARVIYGGFAPVVDEGAATRMSYIDSALVPVETDKKDAYVEMAARMATLFREHGATRVMDAWGVDVPEGKLTDCRRAVKATPGETIVYSWIEWPSKAARDEGWRKIMADTRMGGDMPFDGKRMIIGGFAPLLDA